MFWVPIQGCKTFADGYKVTGSKNSEPADGQALALKTLYAFKQQMTKGGSVHKNVAKTNNSKEKS